MALSPWTVELLRRGLADVAKRAGEPEAFRKLKSQATDLLNELPESAARGLDRVMRTAESSKESVRRWSRKHTTLAVPMLNASGVLVHPEGTGVATADDAIAAAANTLRGDTLGGSAMAARLTRRFSRVLPAGDHALAVASNFAAGLASLSLLADRYSLVVHRRHAVRLPNGVPLPEAIDGLLPLVSQVGAIDSIEQADFQGLDAFCVIQADVGHAAIEPVQVEAEDALQIAVLPFATFAPVNVSGASESFASATAAIAAGFDLVVIDGGGVAGGPNCGILVGRRELIEAITESQAWESFSASDAVHAMMLVTLEMAAASHESLPIGALLATSEENLKGRAERLALRLSAHESIAGSHVAADQAKLTPSGRWTLPSRQVRVRHQSLTADAWANQLREGVPSLSVATDGDEIVIDLRWIAPADDAKIAQAVIGESNIP